MAITISGSGITSANIADGTIVNADINSSAAIDGSKLTGVGATKASSNPLITTNGTLGDQWINTTTGEMFILKDATTNSNVWQGQDGSTVEPNLATVFDKFGDSSAIALYQLNGNATDTGGNYNGSVVGGSFTAGKFGNCFDTTGTAGYVDTNITTSVMANTVKSVSMWVNVPTNVTYTVFMGNHNATQQSDDYRITCTSSKLTFGLILDNGNSGTYTLQSPGTINDGNWHHVVVTLAGLNNGDAVALYLDGSLVNSGTLNTGYHYTDATDLALSNAGAYGSGGTNGKVDQVRLFNKVLSTAEITTLYTET